MWRFDLANSSWSYLSGNMTINVLSDYDSPYPGSVSDHSMIIDSTDTCIYIFGGEVFPIGIKLILV